MKIGYYPGCSLHSTGIEYDMSTRQVCNALDIELVELKDWVCCGSSPAHQCDEVMSIALPAKNLAIAKESVDSTDLVAPCASCYSRLKIAQQKMQDEATKKDIEQIIDAECPDDINVYHALDLITEKVDVSAIKAKVTRPLEGVKVACYYGCLMTRPPKSTGKDNFENPTEMEELMVELGAESVDWNLKTFCCGAAFALTNTDVVLDLTKQIFEDAAASGANAIAVGCPLCHSNLDM
ncbi:MAG: heterodisulfide reductase subunit B, partial [Planctomycetes bacterium]|nr:heterodisulfide reductase subunit B [Planctomycetota bacterium]